MTSTGSAGSDFNITAKSAKFTASEISASRNSEVLLDNSILGLQPDIPVPSFLATFQFHDSKRVTKRPSTTNKRRYMQHHQFITTKTTFSALSAAGSACNA